MLPYRRCTVKNTKTLMTAGLNQIHVGVFVYSIVVSSDTISEWVSFVACNVILGLVWLIKNMENDILALCSRGKPPTHDPTTIA